jgi:hypothetical protein
MKKKKLYSIAVCIGLLISSLLALPSWGSPSCINDPQPCVDNYM